MADTAYDRLVGGFKALFLAAFPYFKYTGCFQYQVTACDYAGQTCDASPLTPELGMPDLVGIPIRSPLLAVKLVPGTSVVIAFEGNSPAHPFVLALPSGGSGALPVARQGDMCWVEVELVPAFVGPAVSTIQDPSGTFWNVKTLPGGVPPGLLPVAGGKLRLYGIAATGSGSVKAAS